ncbi:MAG: beta-lactamase family protein [Defluviitaleaceae bacterium]|nr:beta-lactamase family protein [Defluviitaleaceae bacterium]
MLEKIKNAIPKEFKGVLQIVKNNELIWQEAYGYAELSNKRPNLVDTKFAIASGTKSFVAFGIIKLIEQGKLSFETKLGEILQIGYEDITVKELLTHTSGIPDYLDEKLDTNSVWDSFPLHVYKIRKNSDVLPYLQGKELKSKEFIYSNAGYIVLGAIIEKLTGIDFDCFLKSELFEPLEMANTDYFELDRLPSNCANGYWFDEEKGEYVNAFYNTSAKGLADGSGFTTVDDLNKFWQFIIKNHKEMFETHAISKEDEDGDRNLYGYGFWLGEAEDEKGAAYKVPYMQGYESGTSFISSYDFKKGLNVTIISNYTDDIWELHSKLREIF